MRAWPTGEHDRPPPAPMLGPGAPPRRRPKAPVPAAPAHRTAPAGAPRLRIRASRSADAHSTMSARLAQIALQHAVDEAGGPCSAGGALWTVTASAGGRRLRAAGRRWPAPRTRPPARRARAPRRAGVAASAARSRSDGRGVAGWVAAGRRCGSRPCRVGAQSQVSVGAGPSTQTSSPAARQPPPAPPRGGPSRRTRGRAPGNTRARGSPSPAGSPSDGAGRAVTGPSPAGLWPAPRAVAAIENQGDEHEHGEPRTRRRAPRPAQPRSSSATRQRGRRPGPGDRAGDGSSQPGRRRPPGASQRAWAPAPGRRRRPARRPRRSARWCCPAPASRPPSGQAPSWTSTTSAAITISQPAATGIAAALVRWAASSTRDRHATRP